MSAMVWFPLPLFAIGLGGLAWNSYKMRQLSQLVLQHQAQLVQQLTVVIDLLPEVERRAAHDAAMALLLRQREDLLRHAPRWMRRGIDQ